MPLQAEGTVCAAVQRCHCCWSRGPECGGWGPECVTAHMERMWACLEGGGKLRATETGPGLLGTQSPPRGSQGGC